MTAGTNAAVQNPLDLSNENSVTSDNTPHRFVGTLTYELPFGVGKRFGSNWNGVVNGIAGGWSANAIVTVVSGTFFSPTVGTQNCNNGFQTTCRPDLIGDPALGVSGVDSPRWNINAFDWPNNTAKHAAQAPRLGSAGPNILQGNGLQVFDLSVRKQILFTERFRFEFRAEAFNALNHTNFNTPTTAVDNANFGRTFSSGPSRLLQLGSKLYW